MDPERLLGSLIQGAFTGKSGKKMARGIGGTLGKVATSRQGLTILGGLAIAAIEHMRSSQQPQPAATPGYSPAPPPLPSAGVGAPTTPPPLPPMPQSAVAAAAPPDAKATTLIRAMIAAARADGALDAQERGRILERVTEGGGGAEDTRWLEAEMANPIDLDSLVRAADTPVAGAEIYLASLLAIDADTPAERAYLMMLAARLGLDDATVQKLTDEVARLRAEAV